MPALLERFFRPWVYSDSTRPCEWQGYGQRTYAVQHKQTQWTHDTDTADLLQHGNTAPEVPRLPEVAFYFLSEWPGPRHSTSLFVLTRSLKLLPSWELSPWRIRVVSLRKDGDSTVALTRLIIHFLRWWINKQGVNLRNNQDLNRLNSHLVFK